MVNFDNFLKKFIQTLKQLKCLIISKPSCFFVRSI